MTDEIIDAFQRLYKVEINEIDRKMERDIANVFGEARRAGAARGSRAVLSIVNAAADSVPVRSGTALTLAKRSFAAAGQRIDRTIADSLVECITSSLEAQVMEITERIRERPPVKVMNIPEIDRIFDRLHDALADERERVRADLDLVAMQAAGDGDQRETNISPTITIHGPVGLVQSGSSNVGTVSQHIDQGTVDALSDAFESILGVIGSDDGDHSEIREVVVEAQAELSKSAPNKTRLRGLVSGIYQAVVALPKFHKALETLKLAAAGLGWM